METKKQLHRSTKVLNCLIVWRTVTKNPQAPVILADQCKENSDLKNVVMFLDSLGILSSTAKTSNHLLPFLSTFKRNYIIARRASSKQIQLAKEESRYKRRYKCK